MINYQNGKIYKITGGGLTYIGSTTLKLNQRMAHHKSDYKHHSGYGTKNITSYAVFEHPDVSMTLIEKYPCNDKEELVARERYWIENSECVNKIIPTRTHKEYYIDNKERLSELIKNTEKNTLKKLKLENINIAKKTQKK